MHPSVKMVYASLRLGTKLFVKMTDSYNQFPIEDLRRRIKKYILLLER